MTHGVLIVGLGAIGMGYDFADPAPDRAATHCRAFSVHPAFGELVGVDPDATRRAMFETKYRGKSYPTVEAALAQHNPAVVVIATPTAAHAGTLRTVLALGSPRVVLCEKPLAEEPAAAQAMLEACESRGVAIYVNYMRRADPGVAAVKAMIGSGAIEAPLKGVVWYSKGLIHNGSHFVDLMRHWLGPIRTVQLVRSGRRWQEHDPEPDFLAEQALGSSIFLAAQEECFSHYTVEIVARNGRLRYEQGGERVEWQPVSDDPAFPGYRILRASPEVLPADLHRSQWHVAEQLALALAGHETRLCTGREALLTLQDIYRVLALL